MELTAIITLIALLEYSVFAFRVGSGRAEHDVEVPLTTGAEAWMRAHRVHQNTLEQLIVFLPALWLFSHYWGAPIGAGIGAIFIIARPLYAAAYVKNPPSRTPFFIAGYLATMVLVLGALAGAVKNLL